MKRVVLQAWPIGCPTILFFLYCCSQVLLNLNSLVIICSVYCFITIVNSHNIQDSPFSDGHRGEELGDKAGDGGGEGEDPVDGGLHHLPGGPSNISQET